MSRFRRTRTRLQTSVITLVAATLVAGVSLVTIGLTSTPASAILTSGFTITSTIYTTPSGAYGPSTTCSGTPALLYPGNTRCVVFTVTNNLKAQITVQSITTTFDSAYPAPPSGCAAANLNLPSFAGSFNVLGTASSPHNTANSPGVPMALKDSGNQDNCKGATLHFKYSGTAIYTDPTTTFLTSSSNPSNWGQSITFTATVTGNDSAYNPNPASGTVNFYKCPTASPCTSMTPWTLLGTGPVGTNGKATFATSSLPVGTTNVEAVYTPSVGDATNYITSTSTIISQNVTFSAPCITKTVSGGYTVASGRSICIEATVNGTVTVQSGGALFLSGAKINGGVTSTGANALQFCGSQINGSVTASGTTGFVKIGDGGDDGTPGCAGNTITINMTLTSNLGGFEVGANHIGGTATFTSNTGAGPTTEDAVPEVEGNTITGSLSCATSNNPALIDGGQKNTVTGTKSGQCSGATF